MISMSIDNHYMHERRGTLHGLGVYLLILYIFTDLGVKSYI